MRTIKCIQLLVLLNIFNSQAQNLKGYITESNGNPLQDVVVVNKTNTQHTHTDADGYFELAEVTSKDQVVFSHIGYENLIIAAADYLGKDQNRWTVKPATVSLAQIVINPAVALNNQMLDVDLKVSPVRSSQELLQKVPGLFIGQHAGGGKAEQIFLRGFDIDHGTDINLSVDGLPVNMVSHAHGQGYSDLHFIIPETLDQIDFGKGPYEAQFGDFATAGYVTFKTKDQIASNKIAVNYGDFASFRTVGMFRLLDSEKTQAYAVGSINAFDGPFISPQNFNRSNLFAKLTTRIDPNQKLQISVSSFSSKWNASGQIPWRAVRSGQIDRFGAIDDTEGGQTSRSNLVLNHFKRLKNGSKLRSTMYYSRYDFELYSNFTFFLENPIDGDQIRQFEKRQLMGFQTQLEQKATLGKTNFKYTLGAGLRYDNVDDLELSRTKDRRDVLERLALGNVDQTHGFAFANATIKLGKWQLKPGLRLDGFQFDYTDRLAETFSNPTETALRLSPRFNLFYQPDNNLQFYLKNGLGFHSNDTRVSVNPGAAKETLPKAFGTDLGFNWKPSDKLFVDAAIWSLFLEQEFVYVGDEAIVEPSGKTRRLGFDLGLRYEPLPWLYLQQNLNYAYARSQEAAHGADFIPLAPNWTATGSLNFETKNGFSGGLRYRFIDDRPANEDNSIVAGGYFISDASFNYSLGPWSLGLRVENIFNRQWEETQFATNSRLRGEAVGVEEIHFTPGTPRFISAQLSFSF